MVASVRLRTRRHHWGPINRKEVQLVADADDFLQEVEALAAQSTRARARARRRSGRDHHHRRRRGDGERPPVPRREAAMTPVSEKVGKVASATIEAMKSTPLAIALLVVNVTFLGFAAYILGEVAANASERNKSQLELITNLVRDIRDCGQGPT
jgi:hypothetical protein